MATSAERTFHNPSVPNIKQRCLEGSTLNTSTSGSGDTTNLLCSELKLQKSPRARATAKNGISSIVVDRRTGPL